MRRLLYRSRPARDLASSEVFAIIAGSQQRNAQRGITGFLLDYGDAFLQLIEGAPLAVAALMDLIEADPRHEDVEVLVDLADDERWFPDWSMKHLISFSGPPAIEELRHVLRERDGGLAVLGHVEAFLRP